MFGKIADFFKALGHFLGLGLKVVTDHITDAQIQQAIVLVNQAVGKFADNAARREWVVTSLMSLGMPEFAARIAVEMAWKIVKEKIVDLEGSVTK